MNISNDLEQNIRILKETFIEDQSLKLREFSIGGSGNVECLSVFIEGMVDMPRINTEILKPLLEMRTSEANSDIYLPEIIKNTITSPKVETISSFSEAYNYLINGHTLIFINEYEKAVAVNTLSLNRRGNMEPDTEKVVRGPREGFNESIFNNLALVRARIRSEDFKVHFREIGRITKTKICICYLESIAHLEVVEDVKKRIDSIDIDGIIDSGYIQELITDAGYSPFRTIEHTERPDVVARKLLNGKVAILCDGSPFVLTMPFFFVEYFHVSEDYYNNFYFSSFNRLLSFIGFFLSTSIPAIYTALVTYHQEMLPTPLILSISAARQGIPLPTIAEMVLMLFVFEVLREASVRIPAVIGQTISIVGALIIGQAAVEAKLISAPIIIVSAASGITGFLVPKMEQSIIIARLFFLISAAFLGLYGYIFAVIIMFIHLTSIRSFGMPYMMYISSMKTEDQINVVFRGPWWSMRKRPRLQASKNINRQKS